MITGYPIERIPRRKDRIYQILGRAPKHLYPLPALLFFVLIILGEVYEILVWIILLTIVILIMGIEFSERKIWQKKWSDFAKETGLNRESLYKSLSGDGNPGFATIKKITKVLGIHLVAQPEHTH